MRKTRYALRNRWHELVDTWNLKSPGQTGEGVVAIALGVILLALLIGWPVNLRG